MNNSTPSINQFNPNILPAHRACHNDFCTVDWSLGVHEFFHSGSVGSGKSIFAAHKAWLHLLSFPRSRLVLARRALPDLRDTIFTKMLEHIEGTVKADGSLVAEGVDFGFSTHNCKIWLANGSNVISRSWADKNYKKLGSIEASAAIVEELAENDGDDWQAISYLRMRVGRLPHVPQSWIMYCTNPDSPSHPAYADFELGTCLDGGVGSNPLKHVYFSNTEHNPFLPSSYIEQLQNTLDPKMYERMGRGRWVEITTEVIYHQYNDKNFVKSGYQVDEFAPIHICHDFNIGQGKPMSACAFQVRGESAHFFQEWIVEGADTEELMEEIGASGILDYNTSYLIHGDATGASKSSKSKKSDYDIISKYLSNYRGVMGRVDWQLAVPKANPPIRERHNTVNALCRSYSGKTRLYVYNACPTLHKGFKLTQLKKGGNYVEDDTKPYQHVTTAAGYGLHYIFKRDQSKARVYEGQFR